MSPVSPSPTFRILFGSDRKDPASSSFPVEVNFPIVDGCGEESFPVSGCESQAEGFGLVTGDELMAGAIAVPLERGRALEVGRSVYERLFKRLGDWHLCRVWNYIPHINRFEGELENYQAFCAGRSLAWHEAFGDEDCRHMPAATGVGVDYDVLTLVFLASKNAPRHFENPLQVPAYRYPDRYGPRPPSFARATVVETSGRRQVFIAGTSAIRGYETVAAGDVDEQLSVTFENLSAISRACDLDGRLERDSGRFDRAFKVYVRQSEDFDLVRKRVEGELSRPNDRVTYLQSDICRSDLTIEIEASLFERG